MTKARWWRGGILAAGLLVGAGCATDQSSNQTDAPPPIMEPGIGGAGQSGVPVEQVPQGTGQPEDEARPPSPTAPAPVSPGAPPEPQPPPPPPPGPSAQSPRRSPPDVAQSPAGGESDAPLGERRSGEDGAPANIHVLDEE